MTQHGWCGHGVVGEDKERPPHWHSSTSKEFLFGGISTNQLTVCINYDEDDTVTLNSCQFHEASFEMIGHSNAGAFIRLDQLEVVISCYRFKSLIMMYFAFILEHFMWCFSPPSNFIHRFMRWYRWMAWRGLPTTNSFTRHSVSWAHLPNLLPSATACDPFKKKESLN